MGPATSGRLASAPQVNAGEGSCGAQFRPGGSACTQALRSSRYPFGSQADMSRAPVEKVEEDARPDTSQSADDETLPDVPHAVDTSLPCLRHSC